MEKQHFGGLCPYISLCSVPCGVFAELSPSSVGEGGAVQVSLPRMGRGMWLEAGPAPALLYAIPAGGTASAIPAGPGRCLDAGKGGGQGSSTSQGQQCEQGCKGEMHHRQQGASSVLSPRAARRGCCECGATQLQTQNWASLSLRNREKTRHPSGRKVLFRPDF